jgi:hypothetical protein
MKKQLQTSNKKAKAAEFKIKTLSIENMINIRGGDFEENSARNDYN